MSAATDLQAAIAAKLAATHTATVGNGTGSIFAIPHGFGTKALYASVLAGETVLVNGTDFEIGLTNDDTVTITALGDPPALDAWTVNLALLRKAVPIVEFKSRDMAVKVEAAAAGREIGLYVWPPLPSRIVQGVPFVFVESAEVRVTIIEQPQMNKTGVDAYDLVDDVMAALHWQAFGEMLAHPLQLAGKPTEMIWNPSTRFEGLAANTRMIDVIFEATYGLQPSTY